MLERTNQCSNHHYLKLQAKEAEKACTQIPEYRRESLREEILARANILGVANSKALQATLASLM